MNDTDDATIGPLHWIEAMWPNTHIARHAEIDISRSRHKTEDDDFEWVYTFRSKLDKQQLIVKRKRPLTDPRVKQFVLAWKRSMMELGELYDVEVVGLPIWS